MDALVPSVPPAMEGGVGTTCATEVRNNVVSISRCENVASLKP